MPRLRSETTAKVMDNGQVGRICCDGQVVPIHSLLSDPHNARLHPEKNIKAIKESLTLYGQRKALVVREENSMVAAGNGTLQAAKELGWTHIAASIRPMTDAEFRGFGIADNRTGESSQWNEKELAAIAKVMEDYGEPMVGFTDNDILRFRSIVTTPSASAPIFSDEQIIDAAYHHFRDTGFPYPKMPVHVCMQEINRLARLDNSMLMDTTLGKKVADSYNPHRWKATVEDMYSPLATYEDDERFHTALVKTMQLEGGIDAYHVDGLRYSQGTQQCANFRPGFALLIYRKYCPDGGSVLDTSIGYGGRLVGFLASKVNRYVGIDPSAESCRGCSRMAGELGFSDRIFLYQRPAEDLTAGHLFKVNKGQAYNLAFTSPPYFRKEHYSEEPEQSWLRYPSGESWRNGFLVPMLKLQWDALKIGGHNVVNIADVTLKGITYPLVSWTIRAAKSIGFRLESTMSYPLSEVPGAGSKKSASEPVLIFVKE